MDKFKSKNGALVSEDVLGHLLFSLCIYDISTDIGSEIRLFAVVTVYVTEKLRIQRTHWNFRRIRCAMISTCQIQYDANMNKKTDEKKSMVGTVFENVDSISILRSLTLMIWDGIHMPAIVGLRSIGSLTSWNQIYTLVCKRQKRQHIKDWCAQSWSIAVLFGTLGCRTFKMSSKKFNIELLDL